MPSPATTIDTTVPNADTTPASLTNQPVKGVDKAPVVKTADTVTASTGTYTVAPGRTVTSDDGKPKGPGEKVTLSKADAERLLPLGFVLDADGAIIVRADGPAVNVEDGVQIAQPA